MKTKAENRFRIEIYDKTRIFKKNKGITLIALVITIVILIILATITISTLTGENGLITQTESAKEQTEIAEAKEMAQMDIADWIMSKLVNNEDTTINNSIIKQILTGKEYVKEAKDISFITKKGEHEIFYSDLNIENKNDENTDNETENGINIEEIITGEAQNNYTDKILDLGIPLMTKYPSSERKDVISRRVWDMQFYNNRIYIGSGDYDQNTGPVDVYYYDIDSNEFINEGTLPDEQINRFIIIDDKIMIPGTDPKEGWELGNYYVWEDNTWIKKRNLPGGVHCFDLIEYKGNIFAGIDSESDSTIVMSTDGGETFSYVYMYDELGNKTNIAEASNNTYRVYDLFELQGSLYAFCNRRIYKYNETENRFYKIAGNSVNYGYMPVVNYVPLKTKITFKDKLILVNGTIKYTDDLETYKTVFFDKTTHIYDVIERNGEIYFLCNSPVDDGYITSVYKTRDCENFELVLYYSYMDYAFSFECDDNNCFYFGIATDIASGEASANSGKILRIEL